jgi:hypothetical protein
MVLAPGIMYRPTDIAVTIVNNSVYVVEQFNHRISKWTHEDGFYDFTIDETWGSNGDGTSGEGGPIGNGGSTDNSLYRPTGIVWDGTRLVVTDTFHNRIRTLNAGTGAWIASTGQGGTGSADTDFYHPAGIATDGTTLVIADELNHRAVRYATAPTPTFGGVLPAPTPLGFNRPHGVFFDTTNSLFNVTDSYHGVISNYNTAATVFNSQFGTPGTTGTDMFFPGSGHGTLTGDSTTAFADTRNNVLKTITNTTIGQVFDTSPGTGNGQMYWPESVESFVDAATNYVLVANTLNNRVEAYSNDEDDLTFESNFGSP